MLYKSDFDLTVTVTIDLEGGDKVTNDPRDPGGLTKYGISQKAFPHVDIANLTLEKAKDIYRLAYWQPFKCDALPFPVAFLLFDWGVTSSYRNVAKTFQKVCGVKQDAQIGPKTIAACLAACKTPAALRDFCIRFTEERAEYYDELNNETYDDGWRNRAIRALGKATYYWLIND